MQQWIIILWELSPLILGGVVAVGVWLATRRHGTTPLRGRAGVLAAIGGLVPVVSCTYSVVRITPQLLAAMGLDAGRGVQEAQFLIPLAAGLVALAVLCVPGRRNPSASAAGIARRTAFTFLSSGWTVALTAIAVVTVALSLAAGLASVPDQAGNYTMLTVQIGTMRVGTTIYGWYYSIPAMALLMVLIGTAWAGLALVARPPLGDAREQDAAIRRTRSRNIAALTTGAIAFHLAAILGSLAGTSRLEEASPPTPE
ncbi:hypothetical protein AHiyo1_51850 [Arthrobacter sp. Hiyo1]|uniref:hypothetical protein n=1 Tax=Arthrobacter sp. Hiyo1 TaxID=1588020 RepID=UPI0006A35F06|nr:hypothetical protein [Arthrobacter sp. Hiyo1]GAP61480.1 hypothetical protein AHiyo1_51850 [Arthrobacter sp. Hiyo1]